MALTMKALKRPPGGLPSGIWHCILEILDHDDQSSLKPVVLCSSELYKLAAPILFRTLHIACEAFQGMDHKWKKRILPTHLCIHMKAIIVVRPRSRFWGLNWSRFSPEFLQCLYHLFKMAKNLQDVTWWHEKYMPGEILHHLYRYRPQARVHIASSKVALCEKINQKDTSVPQFSCIRSIEAKWFAGEYDEPIKPNAVAHYPAQLKNIACRCQSLESLTLISTESYRAGFSDIHPDLQRKEAEASMNERALITLEKGDHLPPIKNLRLCSMRLGPRQSELWAMQLQWQNIKHLSLIEVDWTNLLPKLTNRGRFHALEALEATIPHLNSRYQDHSIVVEGINQFHAFLAKLPPLKIFIGYGFPQETLAVLAAHHSESLNDLRFRVRPNSNTGTRDSSARDPPSRASIHDLDGLFTQFPSLHSLGLSAEWAPGEELPYDLLASIVLETRIRHLELVLPELHPFDREPWPYPGANENTCQVLIRSVDEISATLLSLYIVIGDWTPFTLGSISKWVTEAYLLGERDYAGRMRFRKIRQYSSGRLMREGNFEPQVPPWVTKGNWPKDLRQNIEGRISDLFCGKLARDPL